MKDLLRFLTCGSVDDGKSTLIGRMLYDANLLFLDQKEIVENSDYASLLDGLIAEQEQGITIDVAYRFFTTNKRSFIVADTPGHEQYTRNMAVGASFASLAVLLVDASQGLKIQTYRHARICKMMGINYFVFAINKMDIVDYQEDIYLDIKNKIIELCNQLNINNHIEIPLSAAMGDNIISLSDNMSWYKGDTFLHYLENVDILDNNDSNDFILPIQRVNRLNENNRYYEGTIASGSIEINQELIVLPKKEKTTVKQIIQAGKNVDSSNKDKPVSIALNDELDISRGDILVNNDSLVISDNFTAKLIWMSQDRLSTSKNYYLKLASQTVSIKIPEINYLEDVESGKHYQDELVKRNDIACVDIMSNKNIVISTFDKHPKMGRFLLIDRISNETVAAGIITKTSSSNNNLTYHETIIDRNARSNLLSQKPLTIWLTGLSASGKSTLANAVEKKLYDLNKHTMLLDGDNVRLGLNKDLRFKDEDRKENIRRVAEVCKLLNDGGLIALSAFISPFKEDRDMAREIIGKDNFIEVYVNTPIEVCMKRDPKGLYEKAINGEIKNFTGISSPFEEPINPDLVINMAEYKPEEAADILIEYILNK